MRWLFETIFGLYELLRLGVITRFRFSSGYWQWRLQTAFGRGYPQRKRDVLHAVIEYGRWVHRMRRGG